MSWYVWMLGRIAWGVDYSSYRMVYQNRLPADGDPDELWVRVVGKLYLRAYGPLAGLRNSSAPPAA